MKNFVMDIPGGSMGMIYGVLTLPECDGPVPLVILSHGFGSSHEANMDYAEAFADDRAMKRIWTMRRRLLMPVLLQPALIFAVAGSIPGVRDPWTR